tara:strand:+ start:2613 stop:3035 length:423 start_codon:yes stop_codon:yes gene_type:complete
MKKLPQWEIRLFDFISNNTNKAFKWGKWDCCIFVIEAVKAMTETQIIKPTWNNKLEALFFIKENGKTINSATTKFLKKSGLKTIDKNFITAGDVVLLKDIHNNNEQIMGICTGNLIACVSEEGITYRENQNAVKVWRIND